MNCKPGDRAIIVAAPRNELLIGRIVQVVEPWSGEPVEGYYYSTTGGTSRFWIVESIGTPLPIYHVITRAVEYVSRRPFPDAYLRPLRWNDAHDPRDVLVREPQGLS